MAWIYMFDEGNGVCTKIGRADKHYHDRFRDQQACNPRKLHLRAAIWFDDRSDAHRCEKELKSGSIIPKANPQYPLREWYAVDWETALTSDLWAKHSGSPRQVEPYTTAFQDDLNEGARSRDGKRFQLYAYVFYEPESSKFSKLRFTAYGWKVAEKNYVTGNPHGIEIHSRWIWRSNDLAIAARAKLDDVLKAQEIHLGWYRMSPNTMGKHVEKFGANPCPYRNDTADRDTRYGRVEITESSE